jgi:hypothetical protein
MRAVLKQRLLNLYFFDSCLILTWLSIFGILLLGLLFMGIPILKVWLDQRISPESVLPITAMLFVVTSTVRFLQSYETPVLAVLAITYIFAYVLYHEFVSTFAWWSPLIPACGISILVPPSTYIWEKIKPRPRVRRVHFRK